MVRSDDVVQDRDWKALVRRTQQLKILVPVNREPQKKLALVAAVSYMVTAMIGKLSPAPRHGQYLHIR